MLLLFYGTAPPSLRTNGLAISLSVKSEFKINSMFSEDESIYRSIYNR